MKKIVQCLRSHKFSVIKNNRSKQLTISTIIDTVKNLMIPKNRIFCFCTHDDWTTLMATTTTKRNKKMIIGNEFFYASNGCATAYCRTCMNHRLLLWNIHTIQMKGHNYLHHWSQIYIKIWHYPVPWSISLKTLVNYLTQKRKFVFFKFFSFGLIYPFLIRAIPSNKCSF